MSSRISVLMDRTIILVYKVPECFNPCKILCHSVQILTVETGIYVDAVPISLGPLWFYDSVSEMFDFRKGLLKPVDKKVHRKCLLHKFINISFVVDAPVHRH